MRSITIKLGVQSSTSAKDWVMLMKEYQTLKNLDSDICIAEAKDQPDNAIKHHMIETIRDIIANQKKQVRQQMKDLMWNEFSFQMDQ
jgi:hypothetical protein